MRIHHRLLQLSLFLLIAIPLAYAGHRSGVSRKYQHWLNDEVAYILADEERSAFLALSSDSERDRFIQRFWAIRDPDPSTEQNEYRQEHYRRLKYVEQRFGEGKPGRKTDRGRIYIMHGPPDDISFSFGGNSLRMDIQNPTEIIVGGGNLDKRRTYRLELVRPETEVWTYRHLDGARSFPSYFEIIFSRIEPVQLQQLHQVISSTGEGLNQTYPARVQRDSAIMRFIQGQRIGGEYKILYAGMYKFSDIDEFYRSIFHPNRQPSFNLLDLQLALRDLERSPGEVLYDNLRRKRRLKEQVAARVMFSEFSIDLALGSIRAASGGTLLPLTLGIDPRYRGDLLDVVLELVREDGSSAASVIDSIRIDRAGKTPGPGGASRKFLYQSRLAALPGSYQLRVYGVLKKAGAVAYLQKPVDLPDYSSRQLAMSDLLLFDRVMTRKDFGSRRGLLTKARFLGGSTPIYLKDFVLVPSSDSRFRRREKLTAFFEIYNPGLAKGAKSPSLNLKCEIWRENRLVASIPEKYLDYVTDTRTRKEETRRTAYGLSLPLRSLSPGRYALEMKVYDQVLNQHIARRRAFVIY
ncbi:MAG: GWxTD domain-containing protein [Acidobacteriota bacterium]